VEENSLLYANIDKAHFEIRGYHNFAGGRQAFSTYNKDVKRWPCYHPWFTLGVTVEGKVTVCCADAAMGLEVGNAYDQAIGEIWNSEAVRSIRKEHHKGIFNRWKVCDSCDTWQFHPDIFF
jgi:radical SAM protein with 4Fe4S-binding SPASM domain